MSFPQTCRFLEAGQGGGWGCGPEQLVATVPCASVGASAAAVVPRGGCALRQRAAGHRRETIAGNNPFLLHVVVHVLQGVKAKVPFPQFILHHGWDNPHYESPQRTRRSLFTKCKLALFLIGAFEPLFFQRQSSIPSARFTPNAISSYWGTLGRLGD